MRRKMFFAFVRALVVMLITLTAVFTLTFYLTAYIFQSVGWQPSPVVAQLINSVVGVIFVFIIAGTVGYLSRSRQMDVFLPILEAMRRIAQGDFSVRLDDQRYNDNGLVKDLTQGVNNMALELAQMEAMRQTFISNVSHEIQSPLTSIRGFARALQNNDLSVEERTHYLSIIETESTRLSSITQNLLKLATLESDQLKFEPKPYALDKQIRTLVLASEPQWTEKQLDIEVVLPEVTITADEELLSQVWTNLLHNSIKFTPQGGHICVELQRSANTVSVKVTDTGVGISEEDQAHIFERFYKADPARTHSTNGGSGLGLSIAQKIIDMHKGTITVQSTPANGAAFIVSLPLAP